MAEPPSDPDAPAGTTGAPDRQTLRLLEHRLVDEPLVDRTAFEPNPREPNGLVVWIDTGRYPDSVRAARLDIRWFTTGDFSFHYVETRTDETGLECRWDRHPNPHSDRLHFHVPPDAGDIEPLSLSSLHPLGVSSTVIAALQRRIETHWQSR